MFICQSQSSYKLLKQELELESYTRHISTEVCVDSGMHVFTKLNSLYKQFANQEVLQTANY